MKEAFDRALRVNPRSPVKRVVERLEKDREISELGDKLYLLGEQWYALKVSRAGFAGLSKNGALEELRRIWRERALLWGDGGILRRREERVELLGRLADGIWYSDAHQAIAHSLLPFRTTTSDEDTQSRKRLFVEGFSDLANCSAKERRDLGELVFGRNGAGKATDLQSAVELVAVWMGTQLSWTVAPEKI